MLSQKNSPVDRILSILLSTTWLPVFYAVSCLTITISCVIIGLQSLFASGYQISMSSYLLFVSSLALVLTQILMITLFALIVYVKFLQSPDRFKMSAVETSCEASEEDLEQTEDGNREEGPDQLSASTEIPLQQSHSEGDCSHSLQIPGQIPGTDSNPGVNAHPFPDPDERETRFVIYREAKFSLLLPDVKAAMSSSDFAQVNELVNNLIKAHNPRKVYAQCFGYAIFRNNEPLLRFLLRSACEEDKDFLDQYSSTDFDTSIGVALERGYHSIIGCLNEYFPSKMRKSIRDFGEDAVFANQETRLILVWHYLHDDDYFIRHNSVLAAWRNHFEIVQFLELSSHFRQREINEALWAAVMYQSVEMVQHWLMRGAGETLKLSSHSPLHSAAARNNVDIMSILLDHYDQSHSVSRDTLNRLLEIALSSRATRVADYLIGRGAEELKVSLETAVHAGHTGIVEKLLHAGRSIDVRTMYGSLLQAACAHGFLEIASRLLDHGCELNPSGPMFLGGNSPLMAAVSANRPATVRFLISRGASMNEAASIFGNVLQTAAFWNYTKVVTILLDNEFEVDARVESFPTPLAIALRRGNKHVAKLLIEEGASTATLGISDQLLLQAVLGDSDDSDDSGDSDDVDSP